MPTIPPALPCAEDAASLAAEAALLTDSLAEELTLVKPSDALDVACDTVSLALEAAEETALEASEVVEAFRTATRWKKRRAGRSAVRATEADIVLNVVSEVWEGAG